MATLVTEPQVTRPSGLLRRPTATTGWTSWFTTVDHKTIGLL